MRLRRAMLHSVLQQWVCLVLSLGTGIVIARLLTPHEVGPYSVAMAALSAGAAIKEFGVGSFVISHPEDDVALMKTAFGMTLLVAIGLACGFAALSWPLQAFYKDPTLGFVLRIAAFGQLAPALAFPATMALTRAMRFEALLVVGVAGAFCQSVVSISLAYAGAGAASLGLGFLIGGIVAAATTIAYRPRTALIGPTLTGARRLFGFGGWMSGAMVVGSASMSMPELMIGRIHGLADAALFARAQNIVSIIRNGLFFAMLRPILPSLGAREKEGLSLAPIYLRLIESVTGLAWPAYALLTIWADPLIRGLYGPAWSASAALVAPLAIGHGLSLAVAPHYDVLIVQRRVRRLFLSELVVFLFTVLALLFALLTNTIDPAWALALSGAFFCAWYFAALKPVVGFEAKALLAVWGRSLALTLAVAPAAIVLRELTPATPLGVFAGCAASGLTAAFIGSIAAKFLRHELSAHLGDFVGPVMALAQRKASRSRTAPG
jgi:O-antigen/teichoic acid export membrane protein